MFKTHIFCDRQVYDKKGKWKNPQNDIYENIYYFIKDNHTLIPVYKNGREELVQELSITVYGGKPFIKGDIVILESGEKKMIENVIINYLETHIMIKDLLKPRIESQTLVLR